MRGQSVLVTGAGGFIGSHLAEKLVEAGARVRAMVHYRGDGGWGWIDESLVREDLEVVAGDIRDGSFVDRASAGVDAVFHLAALIGIPYSYEAPGEYVDTNVRGTLNVLEAARRHDRARVVVTSTSEVYGTAREVPVDEGHPLQGQSPYSASKIGADQLALSFHRSFGTPVTVVRPFNCYGPRQSARAVIPSIIRQLLAGERTVRLGNLAPSRDLTFVTDTAAGFIALADCEAARGVEVNLASGKEISAGDLARRLIELIAPEAELVSDDARKRPDASEVDRLLGDASRARALCGWRPGVSLSDGLKRTVEWCRAHPEPEHRARRYRR